WNDRPRGTQSEPAARARVPDRARGASKGHKRHMPDNLENLTFEQALAELERIVRDLEEGKIGLEESLARYETGVALLRRCHDQLQKVEQRIVELVTIDGEGKVMTRPFEHAATVEAGPSGDARGS